MKHVYLSILKLFLTFEKKQTYDGRILNQPHIANVYNCEGGQQFIGCYSAYAKLRNCHCNIFDQVYKQI